MPRVDSYLPLSFCQIIAKEALACRANARRRRRPGLLSRTRLISPLIRAAIKRKRGGGGALIRLDVW